MKFAFVLAGVVMLAGGVAFVATSQPAPQSPLAGDWRCNTKIDGVEAVIMRSVANDGGTRGRMLINDQLKGRRVIVKLPFAGHIRLQGSEILEDINSFDVSGGSVDGHQLSQDMKDFVRRGIKTGSARYPVDEISASRLIYQDAGDRAVCEKSKAPLNL